VGDVEEALRLFSVSTLAAASAGLGTADNVTPEIISKVKAAENRILGMVAAGATIALSRVKERLLLGGLEESIINLAIRTMERRDELRLVNERRTIQRARN
jgi:DNA replication licensing factor MCM5